MCRLSTVGTDGGLLTEVFTVTELLTREAAERVRNERPDLVTQVATGEFERENCVIERQNEKARVSTLAVSEGGDAPHVRDVFSTHPLQEFLLRHELQFRGEDISE